MNDLIDGVRVTGQVIIDGENILAPCADLLSLREKVGMVFQRPNPFPLSIYENIVFGLAVHRLARRNEYADIVEQSLRSVLLWDDLKDRLQQSALRLSLEQQQRLCIARVLPSEAENPAHGRALLRPRPHCHPAYRGPDARLKAEYTIVIVTHNMQQAARASDRTGFLYLGKLIEFDDTVKIFTNPAQAMTENYVSGRFG